MGPEKPPRRSKSDQEPLTIDLEANTAAAQDADRDDTSAERDTAETAHAGSAEPAGIPQQDANASEAGNDQPAISEPDEEDARAEAAAAAFAEEPTSAVEQPVRTEPRTSNSGALAAGILGGLIALLGAGSLQYAGILPVLGPGADNSAIEQSLAGDVEAIKTQLAAAPAPSAAVDLSPIETRIAALEKSATEAGSGAAVDLSGLDAQIATLTGEIATLKSALADARQSTETAKTELSARLDTAEKKIDEPASDVQLARAVAVTALKTAIDRGGPFLAELDALKSIAASDPAVTGLAGDAATGIAPRADLARAFPSVADAMLEATRHTDPNQGIFARLMDSASSAIRVRPVGSVAGEGPEAVVARIEDKLTNGDLKGASLEWAALPEPAKTAGADFKTKLDQRIRVEGLIDAAVAGAMTANQG
ncbi:membrane protein [Pararhizobium polonicum]|uniref:Membrane protein n=1 Tax=Pararhizobium polonicum TaxID=1612624 RepID=A0A1C7NZ76_9HYPH|nr:COG4223 family protein [Pararhizobium polonicum]OBZ94342.1 membrane protein [Pararhizobium polonicum]